MAAAEIAAGAYVAAEVVEHGAQAGYAAYLVSKPTLPLKATFTRIATASDDHTRRSLARSHHTATVVKNKAYIFGGMITGHQIASNDLHVVTLEHSGDPEMDYSLLPALPTKEGDEVPPPRSCHAGCAFHGNIAIYGGCDENEQLLDERSSVWLFNTERKCWGLLASTKSELVPGPRRNAKLFDHEGSLILYGGTDQTGDTASDLWKFDVASRTWTQLPTAPVATPNAAFADGQLWLLASADPLSSQLHHLGISGSDEDMSWESFSLPTNPLVPAPRPRHDGTFLPLTTGWGRNYIICLLGARENFAGPKQSATKEPEDPNNITQFSDTWALQIPSSNIEPKASWSLKTAIKPAKIKDAIRHAIGADTGHLSWAEAVVQLPNDKQLEEDGKMHPGPRAFFAADVMENGNSVVFWGGIDAKGERVGDGWIVRFE